MAKNITGIEKGDILVAKNKAYIYADPNDAALDKEVDIATEGLKFGVATGVTKKGNDGFSYTEMVVYFDNNTTDKFDLLSTKYYVLQATYTIEENPDYDYALNNKKTIGSVAGGSGTGFNKIIDLISGVFGIVQANKAKKDAGATTDTGSTDNTDTTSSGGGSSTDSTQQLSWLQKNKFIVILGGLVVGVIGITVWIVKKSKKKAPTTTTVQTQVASV